ncbi:MAG: 50S ribosomal protein L3 [Planctomycetaceae bacterium]|nr:50S ribosomal protein L3 [Planctomycetaceae bacterium]
MGIGILGQKVGMTQVYDPAGNVISVTVIQAGPCHVLQVKTDETDGYQAVQLGYLDKPRRLARRSERGQVAKLDSKRQRARVAAGIAAVSKAGCEPKRFVREFRLSPDGFQVGQEIKVDVLADVASVDVTGTSKGRGYSGVIKRHNFAGQRATHGVKKCHRHLGGTGCSAYPSRMFKGKRMAGQYGNARCTVRNLRVVQVDAENNLLLVYGAIPGPNGGFVTIRPTNILPGPTADK